MFKKSCENPNKFYICLFGKRYVFEDKKYVGWYKPGRKERRK